MRYLSVCSGIEAATVAWHPLGWTPAAFSEIEAFPCAVLTHHYPQVPLHGDFTTIRGDEYGPIDLLVGGTPCQSFSVAGLRGGLADERGNLALEFLRLLDRTRARWMVWENVPGVLSSGGGRDFGAFLGGLAELGYGFAYRVLDAQHFGVPQRRRRVFVVGYIGDWRRACAVLLERNSLSGDTPPRREKGQGVTYPVAPCLGASGRGFERTGDPRGQDCLIPSTGDISHCLNAGGMGRQDYETETLIAHSLRAEGFDASEDGTGRGTPLVPVAIQERAICENPLAGPGGAGFRTDGQAYTLEARTVPQAVAFTQNQRDEVREVPVAGALAAEPGMKQQTYIAFTAKDHGADASDISPTLRSGSHDGSHANGGVMPAVAIDMQGGKGRGAAQDGLSFALGASDEPHAVCAASAIRRLTPRECERLQGFPDDYLDITYRGKPAADGPKYKALGNSFAVPVMRWIGERIAMVEAIQQQREAA